MTITQFTTTVTVTSIQQAAVARRQEATPVHATPVSLASYPAALVTSACRLAVPSPSPSTISRTVTVTAAQTIVEVRTQTILATATAAVICKKYPLTNGGFETGGYSPWYVFNPLDGQGGAWTLEAGQDAARGAHVAQIALLNPDVRLHGGFSGYISQVISTCAGFTYTVTFDYRCIAIDDGLYFAVHAGGQSTGQVQCAGTNTWYSGSVSWSSIGKSATVEVDAVQNGAEQGIIQFDNIIVSLNQ